MGLNFVTISLDSSYVKNQFLGPSRVVPLWALFSFFSYFFFSRFLSFILLFIFSFFYHFLFISSFFDFLMFSIFFFHFSEEKVSSFLFSCISFKYVFFLALVSEFNCFFRCRCSMEMWCPDDIRRGCWDWATCLRESMIQLPRVEWRLFACETEPPQIVLLNGS